MHVLPDLCSYTFCEISGQLREISGWMWLLRYPGEYMGHILNLVFFN